MIRPSREERFAIRFSREERAALERRAIEEDVTLTHLVRQAIKQLLCAPRGERIARMR